MLDSLSSIHQFYLVYFFYGAVFLLLGFSISITNLKESNLRIADCLWLLGMFGFTHCVREWLLVYPVIAEDYLTLHQIIRVKFISTLLLVIAFVFLLKFGASLISGGKRGLTWKLMGIPIALFGIFVIHIAMAGEALHPHYLYLYRLESAARNTLGFGGSVLTAYGLIVYSRKLKVLSSSISRNFFYAGLAFALYSILVTEEFDDFADAYLMLPDEVFRGFAAAFITFFLIRALNIFNIETRRRIEQQTRHLVQSEKLTSLGRLAAGIAHEINNPLTNASLGIQTLRSKLGSADRADREVAERLMAVERNIDKASAIAQELLQFSHQREAEFIPVDINTVIASSLTLLNHKLKTVVLEQSLTPVPAVLGDRGKLEQVFINVLSNAMEAMPRGGVLSISTIAREDMVEIRISDTGHGIAESDVSRVFEPFFTTRDAGAGTGLGLFISYGIIMRHNGEIKLASVEGKGTTVTIQIPASGKKAEGGR